jgi:predicted RNA-binding Zn ribbon-like protein
MNDSYTVEAEGTPDEAFLLALLNTTPTIGGVRGDVLDDDAAAREWLGAQLGSEANEVDLAALREARTRLQSLVEGERGAGGDLRAMLNGVTLRPGFERQALHWNLAVPPGREPAVRAILTWDAIERRSPGRVRPCANEECSLYLIDHSKNNSARWCSMAECGNRLKARRYHERRRSR